MKFNKRFYDDNLNLRKVSKRKLLSSILIGVLSAFVIYSFSQVIFETERLISFDLDLYPNILNESKRNFYNLFFASTSLILGNSLAINLLFSRPSHLMSRRSLKRKRIVNEQIFLSFNFAHWFTKMGWMFGTFAMCCMGFEFSSNVKWAAVLMIIVLYLESWKSLQRVLKRKKWKYLLIHALVFSTLSFGMSKINIVNYKAFDAIALEKNPIVDLPRSFFYKELSVKYYPSITFKIFRNKNDKITIRNEFNEELQVNDISSEILKRQSTVIREELKDYLEIKISAENNIELSYLKQIEAEVFASGRNRITYNVHNENELTRSFEQRGFSKRITPDVLQFRSKNKTYYPPLPFNVLHSREFTDTLNVRIGKTIVIDDLVVPDQMLVTTFKRYISKDVVVNYSISHETSYQDYITALSAHFRAVYDLREKDQIIKDRYKTTSYYDEEIKLKEKYPIVIIETYNK